MYKSKITVDKDVKAEHMYSKYNHNNGNFLSNWHE